ncbi:MAG: sugar phosphate nucleotidyltransferase, partial [bacterium]|nr:sugar phosphate nucleotidyltransferase [bacterium]
MPIAGLGTRMLPLTKVIPKAMLPVHDRPCVQWIVEELEAAGIKEIIFITSKGQESVQEYFTHKTWYDEELEARGKTEQAKRLEAIRNLAQFHFVEQPEPLGDGHAILQARSLIGSDESFLVIFGDCLYSGDEVIRKMKEAHEQTQHSIIAVQEVEPEEAQNYGIITTKTDSDLFPIDSMVKKPAPDLPTGLPAVVGQ